MSENGRKRSRKSKLVPRDCGDDDCFLQEPARKKSLLEKIKTESDSMGSSEAPLQFSVKVEVEDVNNSQEEDPSDYMKYLFSLASCTPEETESVASPVPSRTSSKEIELPDSPEPFDGAAYSLDPNKMFRLFPLLQKKFPDDPEAVMHCRNLWGKVFHELGSYDTTLSPQERQLQNVVTHWRNWQATSKTRDSPFCYKCYICPDAWWSFSDFRNHIRSHPDAVLKLEIMHQESNIIAFEGTRHTYKKIFVDGKCFKCAKTFIQHQVNQNADDIYFCVHCSDKFHTCTSLLKHAGQCYRNPARPAHNTVNKDFIEYPCKVCDVVFLSKPAQLEHLNVCHTVRSDEPISTGCKTCKLCDRFFLIYHHHVCPKKNVIHECKHCGTKFQHKYMLHAHLKASRSSESCTKCKKTIEKLCMAPEHYGKHSKHFQIVHRCLTCKKINLYSNTESLRQHRVRSHNKMGRRPSSDKILIPKIMLEQCRLSQNSKVSKPRPVKKARIKVQHNSVNIYGKVKGKSYRQNSRRNTEEKAAEEQDVDVETNDPDDTTEKQDKISQITESIDIKPDIIVKEEKLSDDEADNPDIAKALEETAASLIEMDACVERSAEIKEEIKEIEKDSTETEKQEETGQLMVLSEERLQSIANEEQFQNELAAKVERDEPENPKLKEALEAEKANAEKVKYKQPIEVYFPNKVVKYDPVKLTIIPEPSPQQAKTTKDKSETNKGNSSILKNPRCLNTEIANTFHVSQSILDQVTMKLEIKPEPEDYENDLIILNNSDSSIKQENSVSDIPELTLLNLEPEVILNAGYKKRKVYKCSRCDYSGYHREYKEHINNYCMVHSKGKPEKVKLKVIYTCTKCKSGFPCLKKYVLHFVQHGYKRMSCPQCSLVFDSLTRLLPHINSHIKNQYMRMQQILTYDEKNNKGYQCKSCKKVVDMKFSFEHWEQHLELKPQLDKDENAVEGRREAKGTYVLEPDTLNRILDVLQYHNVANSGFPQKIKSCFVCHRTFERQNDCKRHLIEHLLDDALGKIAVTLKLQCQICKEPSPNIDAYKKHMRDHASLPIYQCSLCNKTFSDSSNFTKHKKIHNTKAFVCDLCNKKFQVKQSLEKHIQMHMVTDPYRCQTCNRIFYDKAFYKRHMRQHCEKPRFNYKCIICRQKFETVRLKWDHMWVVHKQRKEAADCPVCKQSFRKLSDVKKHCQDEHMINMSVSKMVDLMQRIKSETNKSEQSDKDSDDDVLVIEEERETLVIFDDDVS